MKVKKIKLIALFSLLVLELNYLLPLPVLAQTTATTVTASPPPAAPIDKIATLPISSFPTIISVTPSSPRLVIDMQSRQASALTQSSPVVQKLSKKLYRSTDDISLAVANTQNDAVDVAVIDPQGQKADVAIAQMDSGGTTTFDVSPRSQFHPGKYKLIVTDADGKNATQDFTWGVLAINPDRSVYLPGQTADLAMAVLDEQGNMVCDAKLELAITNPSASSSATTTVLSTDNGKITANGQCGSHGLSLKPDYEAHYQLDAAGTYTMNLTAHTKNGSYSISDQLLVKDAVPDSFTVTASTASASTQSYDNMQTVYLNQSANPEKSLTKNITSSASSSAVLAASTSALLLPFTGSYPITEGFGAQQTDPILSLFYQHYGLAGHDGIDFGLPMNTPLRAVDNGTVLLAGSGDYGITIIIQHSWGKSYYGHLSQVLVHVGDQVTRGQQIGFSGNTGEATGPHLHFGMKPNTPDMSNGYFGKIDPLPYFNLPSNAQVADGSNVGAKDFLSLQTIDSAVLAASASAQVQTNNVTAPQSITSTSESPAFGAFANQLQSQILSTPTTANEQKVKVLTWNVSLKKGDKISLGYTFKAPQVSPQFYLLGPLRFYDTSATGREKLVFQETRQWQIAADAVGTAWYDYNWQYRKQITIDHTKIGMPAFDAQSVTTSPGGTASLSWSHTVGTHNNRILIVQANVNAPSQNYISTVKYGGVSLTQITSVKSGTVGDLELWYLLNPASGTANIVITLPASQSIDAGGASFYDVSQTIPLGNSPTNSGSGTTASNTVTTTANQLVVDSLYVNNDTDTRTAAAGQTAIWSGADYGRGSYKNATGTSTTMSWTITSDSWEDVAVAINPTPHLTSAAPPSLDATSAPGGANNGFVSGPLSSTNWTHTTGTQLNRLLVVSVQTATNATAPTVTSITYNGVNLTQAGRTSGDINTVTTEGNAEIWYLVAPASGAHTIQVNLSGNATDFFAGAATFYNVDQTTPVGTAATTNNGNAAITPQTDTVSSTDTNQMVVDSIVENNATMTVGTGQTMVTSTSIGTLARGGFSYKVGTAGTTTMSWTPGGSDTYGMVALAINPSSYFPVLINLSSDNDLKGVASSNDILFTDSTGQTKLNHEIENFNSGTGELEAWVNVPTLSTTADTIIYMYYGNAAAANQQNVNATWNSNYVGVWHLGETSGTTNSNSTSTSSLNATKTSATHPNPITGQIDGAQQYNNPGTVSSTATDYDQVSDNAALDFGANQNFTVSAWIKSSQGTLSGFWPEIVSKEDGIATRQGYNLVLHNSNLNANWYFEIYIGGTSYEVFGTSNIADGNWHYIVGERAGSTIYSNQDGIAANSNSVSSASVNKAIPLDFGTDSSNTQNDNFVGSIDEVHIANAALFNGWIATEYNNQNSPSTFYTLGSVETKAIVPTNDQLMRHGKWFCPTTECSVNPGKQPYTF